MGMWGSNQSKHCHFTKETPEWQAGLEKKHVLLKAVTEKKDKLSRYPQQRVHTLIHRTCCKPLHQELVPDTQFPEALIPPNRPCRTHFPGIKAFNGKFPPSAEKVPHPRVPLKSSTPNRTVPVTSRPPSTETVHPKPPEHPKPCSTSGTFEQPRRYAVRPLRP